jgi:methylmalonyl-CoA/ethylmalonyl-CoA epimerase
MQKYTPPKIFQFSFVVEDLDAAILHWSEKLNVGPFFVVEHIVYKTCFFRNEASNIDMSVAIAYSGENQIELVQQHNDKPSVFTEFLNIRGEGLQHVGALTTDLALDLKHYANIGVQPIQRGEADNGTTFAYLDTDQMPGTMLELFEVPTKVLSAFEYMKRAANQWKIGDPPRHR